MKVSNFAKWAIGVPYYAYAVYYTTVILHLLFTVFQISWGVGLVMFLTGIGEFVFFFAFAMLYGGFVMAIEWAERQKTNPAGYAVFILTCLGAPMAVIIWLEIFFFIYVFSA